MASASGNMNLTLWAVVPGASGGAPLYLHGSAGSGQFAALDLYLECVSGVANRPSGVMPLYLEGAPQAAASGWMNLYLPGGTTALNGALPLYLSQSGLSFSLPLYVRGSGVTAGAVPHSAFMNLFLDRATAEALPLFLAAPGTPSSGALPCHTVGGTSLSLGLPLYASGVGSITGGLPLRTHGF